LLLLALGCEGPPGSGVGEGGVPSCVRDGADDPATALPLVIGAEQEGHLCPIEDEDWYSLSLGPDQGIVEVTLALGTMRSPIEPTYTIYRRDAGGGAGEVVAMPPIARIGSDLELVHCIGAGEYLVSVRDQGADGQDVRNAYHLRVDAIDEPDSGEPNDGAAEATAITAGADVTGHVGCHGDEDWYRVEVPSRMLLHAHLEMDAGGIEPRVRLLDASEQALFERSNPAGAIEPTALDLGRQVAAGSYYVVVSDDDGADGDPETPYTLTVELRDCMDDQEPNDHPREAIDLPALTCGGSWSATVGRSGTVCSPGDGDWFRVPLNGCDAGVIEVEMRLRTGGLPAAEAWELQREVQASVTLIRPHADTPCSDDVTCRTLSAACSEPLDCAGMFEACTDEGLCGGAAVCLAEGACGAGQTQRSYTPLPVPEPATTPPPDNVALVSAPLLGDRLVYLQVGDFQGNGGSPAAQYDLTVRVRSDPDAHEVNNLYVNELRESLVPIAESVPMATAGAVTVHDCTAGDCCGAGTWVEGRIAYQNDLDLYRYGHPCPGGDCMVRLHYQIDAGPVDHVFAVLDDGGRLFFDRNFGNGSTGTLGGLGATDDCFYASRDHESYVLLVRDFATPSRDWDTEQRYRFCVEKIAASCQAPCMASPEGCGLAPRM
jgi:hypothetical protein